MKGFIFALLTSLCWSIGGYFEKKGLHLGQLSPVMGIAVRTAVACLILGLASAPHWPSLRQAGPVPIIYLVLGGGVVAGSLGMLSFYAALGTGELSRVMPVAFGLTPLLGFLLGTLLLGETVSIANWAGVLLTCAGVTLVTIR